MFTKTLFAFDFDGTLSKIVKDPEKAKINDLTLKLIRRLGQIAPVAVISGRSLSDLKSRLPLSHAYLVGNHGLEGLDSKIKNKDLFEKACETWKKNLQPWLNENKIKLSGVETEDKKFSIAIHYRKSRQKRVVKTEILNVVECLNPRPRIVLGKCVINLIPVGAPHKGMALLELMQKSSAKSAFYIGDDDSDEDIFSLGDPRIFTVRIGQKRKSQAKFHINRQIDIQRVLKTLQVFLAEDVSQQEVEHAQRL